MVPPNQTLSRVESASTFAIRLTDPICTCCPSPPPGLAFAEFPTKLSVAYRQGSSTPEQCWYLIGYGIRAAQDIGLNRRKPGLRPTVENELRKRVFWMFILADSLVSAAVGRPPGIELSEYVD